MLFEQYIGEALVVIISAATGWIVGLKRQKVDTKKIEIDVLEKSLKVLQTDVVEPLRETLNLVQEDNKLITSKLNRLQNAINKMYNCHALPNCPIRLELQKPDSTNRKARDQRQPTNRQREPVDDRDNTPGESAAIDDNAEPYT